MDSPIPTIELSTPPPPPPPPPLLPPPTLPLRATARPSLRSELRSIRGELWERVGHRPMKRRRVQASLIWEHGDEYSKANREGEGTSWLCDYCDVVMTLSRSQTTSNILRHLREEHRATLLEPINRREERASRGTSSNSAISRSSSASRERTVSSLLSFTHRVDIVEFRNLLLRWIIQQQIPYSAVDQPEFRDLLLYLAPGLKVLRVEPGRSARPRTSHHHVIKSVHLYGLRRSDEIWLDANGSEHVSHGDCALRCAEIAHS